MSFLEKIEVNPKISLQKGKVYPFVEMANVGFYTREPALIDEKPFSSGVKFEDGDTVVARITPCLQNGKGFYCHGIGKGFGSTEYLVFRPKDDSVDNQYLYYLMQTNYVRESMIKSMVGSTGRQRVNNDVFTRIDVDFPEITVQRKVADILSAYENLIENNQKQIKLLEEAAQRLYKEWFVDLHFPGYEETKIVDGVPEGWKYLNINELCIRVNAGGTPSRQKTSFYSDEGYRWFKTKELQDCWLLDSEEHISEEGLSGSSAKLFPPNTIVMAIYASPTLGRLGILREEAATNQAALCLEVNKEICSWQFLYLKLYELRDVFNAIARGAGQQNISGDTVKNTSVLLPEKTLLCKFTILVETFFEKEYLLDRQIEICKQSRDRLLTKLMSGEIEV